jgi:integrase/recombinase XerD
MELKAYLQERYTPSTASAYLRDITRFVAAHPDAARYQYRQVMDYIGACRSKYPNACSLNRILASVKVYYQYLCHCELRPDHPARSIRLRDARPRDVQLQALFTPQELALLLHRKSRYTALTTRNEVIMTLLVNQALHAREIASLALADVRLEQGSIYIQGSATTNARTLALIPTQIMLLHEYIHQERPRLLRTPTDRLILTKLGTPETGEGIHYLVSTYQALFPTRRLTAGTIRQSVITQLLKEGRDVRVVQVFAGHKYPSATERYKQTQVEELKAAVLKHHPFG